MIKQREDPLKGGDKLVPFCRRGCHVRPVIACHHHSILLGWSQPPSCWHLKKKQQAGPGLWYTESFENRGYLGYLGKLGYLGPPRGYLAR